MCEKYWKIPKNRRNKLFYPRASFEHEPPLKIDSERLKNYDTAMMKLAELNILAHRLPDVTRFLKAYVVKEALLSSAIEGIHTTLFEFYTQELSSSTINKDTQLIINYTQALDLALEMVQKQGLPIVSKVILAMHKNLWKSAPTSPRI